ncbi:MAG: glucose-6-phosphate dehydrogenase assembly protein OpcA [SAR324 cluster bacterium]|nr:glucose-6-phosphate dehydrogenase assembly protein OpcA [SAR324 cluster bacterium]
MSAVQEKCVTLASKHPVEPARVEDDLTSLWRQAGDAAQKEGRGNVTRACLWNLVVYNPRPHKKFKDASGHGYGLRRLLDEVILSLPARILRLEFAESKQVLPAGKDAMAWVAAKCLDAPGGKRQIHGEEINLQVHGKSGDSHFPSLVRALLQPSLPIALLGLDDLPHEGWMLEQLLNLCDRVLVDSQSNEYDCNLERIYEYQQSAPGHIVDIGWMRLTPVRYLLAGFFDSPHQAAQLKRIEHIAVEATPGGQNTALLLLGWLLSSCGYSRVSGSRAPGRKDSRRWQAGNGSRRFPVELRVRKGEGGVDGLIRITITAGGEQYTIRQVDAGHVSLDAPHRKDGKVDLNGWSDAELVIAGLGAQGIDPKFVEALHCATALLRAKAR